MIKNNNLVLCCDLQNDLKDSLTGTSLSNTTKNFQFEGDCVKLNNCCLHTELNLDDNGPYTWTVFFKNLIPNGNPAGIMTTGRGGRANIGSHVNGVVIYNQIYLVSFNGMGDRYNVFNDYEAKDSWQLITVRFDGVNTDVFINENKISSAVGGNLINKNFYLGGMINAGTTFAGLKNGYANGYYKKLKVFNTNLSDEEIKELYLLEKEDNNYIEFYKTLEENIADSKIGGSNQIHFTEKGNIYTYDKIGNKVKLGGNSLENEEILKKITEDEDGNLLFNGKPIETEIDTSKLLDKDTYDSDNDGIVDKSKVAVKIEGIESASLFSVYGKSPTGEEGFYEFPIGKIDENKNKFQSVKQNVKANTIYTIDLINENKLNDFLIQCYEFKEGEQDIVTTLKEFNNGDKDNFYYNSETVDFDDGMKIKNNYSLKNTLNSDNLYETEIINVNDFIEILEMEVK